MPGPGLRQQIACQVAGTRRDPFVSSSANPGTESHRIPDAGRRTSRPFSVSPHGVLFFWAVKGVSPDFRRRDKGIRAKPQTANEQGPRTLPLPCSCKPGKPGIDWLGWAGLASVGRVRGPVVGRSGCMYLRTQVPPCRVQHDDWRRHGDPPPCTAPRQRHRPGTK